MVGAATGRGRHGWGGALLMRDVCDRLIPEGDAPVRPDQHAGLVDGLARLSAHPWGRRDDIGLLPPSIRRVLAPSGRAAVSLAENRAYAVFAAALDRHSAAAGEVMRSPFALGDQEALRGLLTRAGLEHVHVTVQAMVCRFRSPAELLRQEALSSPLAGPA